MPARIQNVTVMLPVGDLMSDSDCCFDSAAVSEWCEVVSSVALSAFRCFSAAVVLVMVAFPIWMVAGGSPR